MAAANQQSNDMWTLRGLIEKERRPDTNRGGLPGMKVLVSDKLDGVYIAHLEGEFDMNTSNPSLEGHGSCCPELCQSCAEAFSGIPSPNPVLLRKGYMLQQRLIDRIYSTWKMAGIEHTDRTSIGAAPSNKLCLNTINR